MLEKMFQNAYHWVELHGLRIVLALLLLVIGQWVIYLLKKWFQYRLHKSGTDSTLRPFLSGLVTAVLQIILILAVIQFLNIRMTIFAALVGAFGVAAGLALSGTLQNFTSGILILLLKPYEAGDYIVAQGQTGVVSSIQLFNTVITTADNRTVIIPNSKLSNEVIINNSKTTNRRIDIEVKLNYAVDPEQVNQAVLSTAAHTPGITREPAPAIQVAALEPDGWKLLLYAWTSSDQFEQTKFALNQQVISTLKQHGVKLPGM